MVESISNAPGMGGAMAAGIAVTFVWVGLVVGISFIEAPLKFRAPGVTLPLGLGIGRLVFKVVNTMEAVLAAIIVVVLILDPPGQLVTTGLVLAVVALAVQLAFIRPSLTRRSNAVLAGQDAPRSSAHHAYIALEIVKLLALLVGGIAALASA